MRIILFGSPGVGKGTQAKILSEKLNVPHISTGEILRNAIRNESSLGRKAKEVVERGELVPDVVMAELIKETLSDPSCKNGFILDGFPRTVHQAQILDEIFAALSEETCFLVKLQAPDSVIVERLTGRMVCSSCGNNLNVSDVSPGFKCPVCGKTDSYIKRTDDDTEVVKKRLNIYKETTKPVFDYYVGKAKIIQIDGSQKVENVTGEILRQLGI